MNIYAKIRKSRVFSYCIAAITCYWLSEALSWIYSLDLTTLSAQAVALATAVLTALVALVRFTFTFASHSGDTKE